MSRADFYAKKYGGGWRTAHKETTCNHSLCLAKIKPGERYFDTQQVYDWPKTRKLCVAHAEEKI